MGERQPRDAHRTTDGMEAIHVIERTRESMKALAARFGGLDVSARLLVGSIGIILVMGMFLVSQYAARPSMASIKVKPDEKLVAIQAIREYGYSVEDAGNDTIRVPSTSRMAILGLLENQGHAAGVDEEDVIPEAGSMMSAREREIRQQEVRRRDAEKSIRMIRGVDAVNLVYNPGEPKSMIIKGAKRSTASVTITPSPSSHLDQRLAEQIGMVAADGLGIQLENITVVDGVNNSLFRFDEGSGGGRRDYLDSTKAWELETSQDLLNLVRVAYPQAEVAVNVQILLADIMEVETDPGKPVSGDTYIESDETSTPLASRAGGQPGFASNSGVNAPVAVGGPGAGGPATRESERRVTDVRFPFSQRTTDQLANFPVKVAASVIIPEQAVIAELVGELGEGMEIGGDLIAARVMKIQSKFLGLLGPLVDSSGFRDGTVGEVNVEVFPFADWKSADEVAAAGSGGLAGTIGSIADGGIGPAVKNAGLVGLALLSLAMMFMMVRRNGVGEQLPTRDDLAGVPSLLEKDRVDLVGKAEEAAPALVGLELDDEELRRRQMLDQLNQLVRKEPSEVASLLRRWMRTDS